jgi:hypothetical protein
MPEKRSRNTSRNRILSGLSRGDFGLLESHLEGVDLPLRKQLEAPNKRIDRVYFIERGFASVVANGSGHRGIEVGLIGSEGMTGLAVIGFFRQAGEAVPMPHMHFAWNHARSAIM